MTELEKAGLVVLIAVIIFSILFIGYILHEDNNRLWMQNVDIKNQLEEILKKIDSN